MNKETLEEVAEAFVESWFENGDRTVEVFKAGAKWQQEQFKNESTANYIDRHIVEALVETAKQERMYNEEELLSILQKYRFDFSLYRNIQVLPLEFSKWFEQFKKK